MAKRKTLMDEVRDELTRDRELNAAYQQERARLKLANQIAALRREVGLSQAQLAERIGTKQAGVARMERAGYARFTVATLAKIAAATGAQLDIRLSPPERSARRRHVTAGPVTRTASGSR
jgi:ribosome-binding protein aMBF1 (putative translation factor)